MKRFGLGSFFGTLSLLSLFLAAGPALAVDADLRTVEITVLVRPDGKATVWHELDWNVTSGDMGGFYFQGEQAPFAWNEEQCWADLADGTRSPLEIKRAGDRWDILLADKQRASGAAHWVLSYGADFLSSGMTGLTANADRGELWYLHWAPPEWDEPLEQRTVHIVLPLPVDPGSAGDSRSELLAQLGFATEEFVNAENSIDWYSVEGDDGASYLTLRFHQKDLPARASQELQFYFSAPALAGYFAPLFAAVRADPAGAGASGGSRPSAPDFDWRRVPLLTLFVFGGLTALAVFLYRKKAAGFAKAVAAAEGIAWAGDSWIPPKLAQGSYAVPGKVAADLHPVEVALLFELPLARVAAIMVDALERDGTVRLVQEAPLRLEVLAAVSDDAYGDLFLRAFDSEGWVLSGLLADFFEDALQKLQEKSWDCDLEATKAHYRQLVEAAEAAPAGSTPDAASRRDSAAGYWYSYRYLNAHPSRYEKVGLPKEFTGTYAAFMASSSCFSGCFTPAGAAGTASACYSACHNACHSACHSACVSGSAH